jgi:hypothetical protein
MTSQVMDAGAALGDDLGHAVATAAAGQPKELAVSHVSVSRFVRNVLLADAAVSAAVGLVMALGGAALQPLLGLPASLLVGAGLFLFAYVAVLVWLSRRESLPRVALWVLMGTNLLWAVECVVIALGNGYAPTLLGQIFLGMNVVTVLVFAELQFICLRRSPQHAMA